MSKGYSYIRFHLQDWIGGTASMPPLHQWAYFRICLAIWEKRAPVPKGKLLEILGMAPDWRNIVEDLIEMGKIERDDDGAVINNRALAEAQHAHDSYQRMVEGGKSGGRKSGAMRAERAEKPTPPSTEPSRGGSTEPQAPVDPASGEGSRTPQHTKIRDSERDDCLVEGARVGEAEPDSATDPPLVPTQEIERNSLVLYAGEPHPMLVGENEMECLQEVYAKGGVHDTGHYLAENLRYVREWAALGCDLNLDVLPAVQGKLLADEPEGVRSLKFYDGAVRSAYAKRMARENGTQPARRHTGARPANALAAAAFADLELSRVD